MEEVMQKESKEIKKKLKRSLVLLLAVATFVTSTPFTSNGLMLASAGEINQTEESMDTAGVNETVQTAEQGTPIQNITAVVALSEEQSHVIIAKKAAGTAEESLANITAQMPQTLSVTVEGSDSPSALAVTWKYAGNWLEDHVGDYTFTPEYDTTTYTMSAGITLPTITVTVAADTYTQAWDGTTMLAPISDSNGVYQISCAEELAWFAAYVNGQVDGTPHTGANAKLTNDIVLNNSLFNEDGSINSTYAQLYAKWTPIGWFSDTAVNGCSNHVYSGTFDGNYHTISGMYIDAVDVTSDSSDAERAEYYCEKGLFSRTEGATVKNLGIIDAYVNGKSIRSGLLYGEQLKGTTLNCYTSGSVSSIYQAGGFAGECAYSEAVNQNCYTTALVTNTANANAGTYAGGTANGTYNAIYYLNVPSANGTPKTTGTKVETAQLADGSIAYALGNTVFGQLIGTDAAPYFLKAGAAKVNKFTYVVENTPTVTYVNSSYDIKNVNDKITIPVGYILNWYTDENATIPVVYEQGSTTVIPVSSDMTCYAVLSKNTSTGTWSKITYKYGNNGIANLDGTAITGQDLEEYYEGSETALLAGTNKVDGYLFDGWYTDAACTDGNKVTKISADATGEQVFYAKLRVFEPTVWDGSTRTKPSQDEDGTYLIKTGEEFAWFAQEVNSGNTSINARLVYDILLNDTTGWTKDTTYQMYTTSGTPNVWTVIGSSNKPYSGTFDGNGKTISGLYLNNDASYQGLFGYLDGATVKNVTLEKGYLYVRNNFEGSITGCANNTVITGCSSDLSVLGNTSATTYSAGQNYRGGLAGRTTGTTKISDSTFSGYLDGDDYNGGIAGSIEGSTTISGCCFQGYLCVDDCTGGIAGYTGGNCRISDCIVTAKKMRAYYGGGLVGFNYGILENCLNLMEGYESQMCAFVYYNYGIVRNCVTVYPDAGTSMFNANFSSGTITNCYYTGTRTAVSNNQGSADVKKVANFSDGSVTYALQLAQKVWAQTLNGEQTAQYPHLLHFDAGAKIVHAVNFQVEGKTFSTAYGNERDTISLPTKIGESMVITGWTDDQKNNEELPADQTSVTAAAENTSYTATTQLAEGYTVCTGEGTKESPYLIATKENLKWAVDRINHVAAYASAYYRLTADITLAALTEAEKAAGASNLTSIGTADIPFTGHFDGAGHAITDLDLQENLDSEGANGSLALFAYVGSNATITNLYVAGSVVTNGKYAAGLVSHVTNNATGVSIDRCQIKVNLSSDYTGSTANGVDTTFGGIVGLNSGAANGLIITNCSYTGTVGMKTAGKTMCGFGGIIGWDSTQTASVSNCYTNIQANTLYGGDNANIARNLSDSKITNCYYVNQITSSTQGMSVTEEQLASGALTYQLQGKQETLAWVQRLSGQAGEQDTVPQIAFSAEDTRKVYVLRVMEQSEEKLAVYGNQSQTIQVEWPQLPERSYLTSVGWLFENETYTAKTQFNYCFGSSDVVATSSYELKLSKNSDNCYEITSLDDWNYLADVTNSTASNSYIQGKHYVLTADIELDAATANNIKTVGTSANTPFVGVLDGAGHKITGVNLNATSDSVGLLGNVSGSTTIIKNLGVSGTITGKNYVGGLAGSVTDHATIVNCVADVTINAAAEASTYHGGIAGCINGATIQNCYSSGNLNCNQATPASYGGIAGFTQSGSSVIHCITAMVISGDNLASQTAIGYLIGGNSGTLTFSDCAYLKDSIYNAQTALNPVGNTTGEVADILSAADFENGSVTYAVDRNQEYMLLGQNLAENGDAFPVFLTGSNQVYRLDYQIRDSIVDSVYGNAGTQCVLPQAENLTDKIPSGYTLSYWCSDTECNTQVTATEGKIALTKDTVYYAKLSELTEGWYTITYENGNGLALAKVYNSNAFTLETPEYNSGYVFDGWYLDADCTAGNEVSQIAAGTTQNQIVYAKWTAEENHIWNGTAKAPSQDTDGTYLIQTGEELAWLAQEVNSGNTSINARLINNIQLNDTAGWTKNTTYQMYTISGTPNVWTVIGSSNKPYSGTFDGNGKTISGLYLNNDASYQGLFGYLNGATVKNVTLEKGYLAVRNSYEGSITGYANNTVITGCSSDVSVLGSTGATTYTIGQNYRGGLAGKTTGTTKISESTFSGYLNGDDYNGGIAGNIEDSTTISGCCFQGYLYVDDYTGGIAGSAGGNCRISDCIVTAKKMRAFYGGGLVGNNNGTVENCLNLMEGYESQMSAFVHYNYGIVRNCVTVYPDAGNSMFNTNFSSGKITNCYYTGTRTAVSKNQGSADVKKVANISDGSVTYALQLAQEDQAQTVWAQTLNGEKTEQYPHLLHFDAGAKTVNAVNFRMEEKIFTTVYGNEGDTIPLPTKIGESMVITGWTDDQKNNEELPADQTSVTAVAVNTSYTATAQLADGYTVCTGEGTKESPYLIATKENLKWAVDRINYASAYASAYYRMTADITLAALTEAEKAAGASNLTSIGTADIPFTGHFDGASHAITNLDLQENLNSEGADGSLALFAYVGSNATITNLSVAGSVVTNGKYAAGLVSHVTNNATGVSIDRCQIKVNLSSDYTGSQASAVDTTFGGIVGLNNGAANGLTVTNCYYTGTVDMKTAGKTMCGFGGIIGWDSTQTASVSNCYTNIQTNTLYGGGNANIARNLSDSRITNCYYVNQITSSTQGISVTAEQLASGELAWKLQNGQADLVWGQKLAVEDVDSTPLVTTDVAMKIYQIQYRMDSDVIDNQYVNAGTNYLLQEYPSRETIDTSAGWYLDNAKETLYAAGSTAEAATKDTIYQLAYTLKSDYASCEGVGTKDAPYLIADVKNLKWAIEKSNSSKENAAAYYQLTSDITLDNLKENESSNLDSFGTKEIPFTGHFDGAGHKITNLIINESLENQGTDGCAALFAFAGGSAVICNLTVEGTITTNGKNAAGIVSRIIDKAAGVTIDNCISKVSLVSSYTGTDNLNESNFGGILGYAGIDAAFTITNSVFMGNISTTNSGKTLGAASGIAGYSVKNNNMIKDCYVNADIAEQVTGNNIAGNLINTTIPNCYSIGQIGNSTQGIILAKAAVASGELAYQLQNNGNTLNWGQTIGTDSCPQYGVSLNSEKQVYCSMLYWNGKKLKTVYTNGEIELPSIEELTLEPGYQFLGWYRNATYTMAVTQENVTINQDSIFYAKSEKQDGWKTITYRNGDKELTGLTPKEYFPGTDVTLPVTTAENNVVFAGWYTSADFSGEEVTSTSAFTDNMILYAKTYSCMDGTIPDTFEASGLGTKEDPYIITTAGQLVKLAALVNAADIDTANSTAEKTVTYAEEYYKLGAKIYLNDIGNWTQNTATGEWSIAGSPEQWTAIGSSDHPFSGHFDGNGYTIYGIYYNSNSNNYGFFGTTENAEIKNINLNTGYIRNDYSNKGAIIGYAKTTVVKDCRTDVSVEYTSNSSSNTYAGGIAGTTEGKCQISGCTNDGYVHAYYGAGGIVGYAKEQITVSECINHGYVCSQLGGGIASKVDNSNTMIEKCRNDGIFAGFNSAGLVSVNYGTLQNSMNLLAKSSNNGSGLSGLCFENDGTIRECISLTSGDLAAGMVYVNKANAVLSHCYYPISLTNKPVYAQGGTITDVRGTDFTTGEATYLLQQEQEDSAIVWGQRLSGESVDTVPQLVCYQNTAKAVHRVTFRVNGGTEIVNYVNEGMTVNVPAYPTEDGDYIGWKQVGTENTVMTPGEKKVTVEDSDKVFILRLNQQSIAITGVPKAGESQLSYGSGFTLGVIGGSVADATVAYAITAGSDYASINSTTGEVTITKAGGDVTIKATKEGNDAYASVSGTVQFTTIKAEQAKLKIAVPNSLTVASEGSYIASSEVKTFSIAPLEVSGNGTVTYVSSNTDVATVDTTTGEVTIQKPGTTVLTATKAADSNYNAVSSSITVTVLDETAPVLTVGTASGITSGSAKAVIQSNESGTYYYAVKKASASKLTTGAEVVAASGANKASINANQNVALTIGKLSANKAYTVYVTVVDTSGNYAAVKTITIKTLPAKNATVTVSGVKYKVTKSSATAGTLTVTGLSNKKATKATIPDNVKINGYTFKVIDIASKAFYHYTKLKSVTIGKNVASIGRSAFEGDKKLGTITIKSTVLKKAGSNVFKNINTKAKIKVPSKKLKAYQKLLKGKGQGAKVTIKK